MSEIKKLEKEIEELSSTICDDRNKLYEINCKLNLLYKQENESYLDKYYSKGLKFIHTTKLNGQRIYGTIIAYKNKEFYTHNTEFINTMDLDKLNKITRTRWMQEVGKMLGKHSDYDKKFRESDKKYNDKYGMYDYE